MLTAVIGLVGCAPGDGASAESARAVSDVHRAAIEEYLDGAPEELPRSILEDSWVTDAELHEAQEGFSGCIKAADSRLEAKFRDDGGYDVGPAEIFHKELGQEAGDQRFDAIVETCDEQYLSIVPWLYLEMRSNPEGVSWEIAVQQCFAANGIPDGEGLSEEEFGELIDPDTYKPASDEAVACLTDPYT
ncbi:hypothetical protein [Promicromonospora sukumoe]|uniref:hypothetical protein n=1 Tax=Promicromonospora sukumoe TaxID=88382 RepID=UPI0036641E89